MSNTSNMDIMSDESDSAVTQVKKPKICYWETIPDEIREKIFEELDPLGPDGVVDIGSSSSYFGRNHAMPALVVALRDVPISYTHVMDWFAKANAHLVVSFDPDDCDLNDMTPTELEVVKSAELIFLGRYDEGASFHGDAWHLRAMPLEVRFPEYACLRNCVKERRIKPPRSLKQALLYTFNLREVDLRLATFDTHGKLHFLTEFPFCLEGLKHLPKVNVHLSKHIWELCYFHHVAYKKVLAGMITHLNQKLGVRGEKLHTISRNRGYDPTRMDFADETDKWTLEAYPGQLMNWSKKLGRTWKFPQVRWHQWTPPVKKGEETVDQDYHLENTARLRGWNWEMDYEVSVEVAQSRGIRMGYGELSLKDIERHMKN